MENALGESIPVGIYRSEENSKYLQIKVKLKKVLNLCLEETDAANLQDSIELVNLIKSPTKEIECIFSWQKKDKHQIDDAENGNQKGDYEKISLFSITDTEMFDLKLKSTRSSTYPSTPPNHIENMINSIKSRRLILQSQNHKTWQKPFFLHTKQLIKSQACYKRPLPFPSCQSMVIVAQLNYEDSANEEIELCHLRIDSHGVLTVIPDFSKDKPYIFLNSRSETYQYFLEDVFTSTKNLKSRRKKDILKKIEKLHKKRLDNLVGNEFFKPSPNTYLCYLNFEIVYATNFLAEDIFIHYKCEIPNGCIFKSGVFEGITQTCRSKNKYQKPIHNFGYIFSKEVEIDLENFKNILMPKLEFIIEVTSVDKWGNFRNEGYGYCEVILKAGSFTSKINTWMLRPTSLTNQLRHFFIGGTPCLENLSYIRVPSDAQESELSKFGLHTETSGEVIVKYSIILQAG